MFSLINNKNVLIVAEISANHMGDFEIAKKTAIAACQSGVDAVKVQTYTPDTMTINSKKEWFQIKKGPWQGRGLYELYQETHMPWDWQKELKKIVESHHKIFFSAPFDKTALDFLEKLNIPFYKIGSPEIIDLEFLKQVAQTKKPVILSRGMSSLEELSEAISALKQNGSPEVVVLHCLSSYPAKPEDMNMATMFDIKKRFNLQVGLSDHSLSNMPSVVAVAMGASVIEKHFTLNRSQGGADSAFSVEPKEMKELANEIRKTEKIIGKIQYGVSESERDNVDFRRSLFIVRDIRKGEEFSKENIRSIRPGYGLAPKHLLEILGKKAKKDIDRGEPLINDLIL